jgi:hypothetical protein
VKYYQFRKPVVTDNAKIARIWRRGLIIGALAGVAVSAGIASAYIPEDTPEVTYASKSCSWPTKEGEVTIVAKLADSKILCWRMK